MQLSKNKAFSAAAWTLAFSCITTGARAQELPRLPERQSRPSTSAPVPLPDPMEQRDRPIEIVSDHAEYSPNGDAVLKNAEVIQGEHQITADDIEYDAAAGTFRAKGSVMYRNPQLRLSGQTGTFDSATGARVGGARFDLLDRGVRGTAREIAVKPGGRITLDDVNYTACPEEDMDWVLKAQSLNLDTAARNGSGRNVRLDFKGVPILYAPFISFPLGNERKSGFLPPDIGHSNRGGLELSIPYYFNLAPNLDLTLTPRILSRRGLGLDHEFRYLTRRQRGIMVGRFLPGDDLRNRDRSLVEWNHRADFAANWRFIVNASNASDGNYFEDFGLGSEGASIPYLERTAELHHFGRHWELLAQVQNFQTIDQNIPDASRPYSRLPRVIGRGEWRAPLGLEYRLNSELVYFHRDRDPGMVTGGRLDVSPELSWSFTRPGLYITPTAAWRQTQYRLENTAPDADDAPDRGAPIGSLDAGMIFERIAGRDANRIHTLEPRLLYLYVPYRDQTALPVFDTGLPDLNLVQLFRRNRYVGADRLSDANQLSAGITTRLLDADDGSQYLSATVGQTYYFDAPRVALPGEVLNGRDTSNFISQLSLTAFHNWNISIGHEWNHADARSEKTELAVQYRRAGNKVINAGYRFRRDLIEQVDASAAWPVAQRWNVYARGVYSLRDSALIEQFAGFEYAACCWKLRMVQRRYVSDRTGERDSSIVIQLELTGLSSIGMAADAFLQRSIRGYSREPAR